MGEGLRYEVSRVFYHGLGGSKSSGFGIRRRTKEGRGGRGEEWSVRRFLWTSHVEI